MIDRLLFSSSRGIQRVRRPLDAALAVVAMLLLFPLSQIGRPPGRSERLVAEITGNWPDRAANLWAVGYSAALVGAAIALLVTVALRRYAIAVEVLLACAIVVALLLVGMATVGYHWTAQPGTVPAITWPPAPMTLASTVLLALAVDLAVPWRSLALWLIGIGLVASVLTVETSVTGAIAVVLVAVAGSSLARLAIGTSAGLLSSEDMSGMLHASGASVTDLRGVTRRADGVMVATATDDAGRNVQVKIRGRDAIEGRRVTRFWRSLAYRGDAAALGAGRGGVEGEALTTLLAADRGVPVWPVVSVMRHRRGAEVLVLSADGAAVGMAGEFRAVEARQSWEALCALHRADIAHLKIQPSAIFRGQDGAIGLTDLAEAQIGADDVARQTDHAQLFGLHCALIGPDAAIDVVREAMSPAAIEQFLPLIQPAAFSRELRRAISDADVDIDAARVALADAADVTSPELIPLRKLSLGAVIRAGLLVMAAATLIPMMLEINWRELRTAAGEASLLALVGAFIIGQVPRPFQAFSTIGAVPARLPYLPVYVMQLATAYLNIALPNAAARMALSVRFFKRQGVPPATAVTSGLIESIIGNAIQVLLLIVIVTSGAADFHTDLDLSTPSGPSWRLIGVLAGVAVVAIAVVAFVPKVRNRIVDFVHRWWPQVRTSMEPLRDTRKLGQILGGSIGAEILFALTLLAFTEAFGGDISLPEALVINIGASLLATLLPVPGGIGISESALIVGLTSAGVDAEIAFASAISTRLATFYLPSVWGWFALRWLTKRSYI